MDTLSPPIAAATCTLADRASANNWAANLHALSISQPELVKRIQALPAHVEWLFARDGYLSARHPDSRWFSVCSVPHRTAEVLLQTLKGDAPLSCFLTPTHPAQLRVAVDKLERTQAIVAMLTDAQLLRVFLACDDFSREIDQHRLWFVAGPDCVDQFKALLTKHTGLPTPSQFIRTRLAEESVVDPLISQTQAMLAPLLEARAAEIARISQSPVRNGVCLVAGSHFRLWDDATHQLASVLAKTDVDVATIDSDDPLSAAPIALAQAAAGKAVVVTANIGRSDLPALVNDATRWITWVTAPRVPAYSSNHSNDVLLLADESWMDYARQAGWPQHLTHLVGWPIGSSVAQQIDSIALISDTRPVVPPKSLADYSSHRLLWEKIEAEILADPFILHGDVYPFLESRQRKLNINDSAFDPRMFIEQLILPLYQHGLARTLIRAGIPLKLFGRGWDKLPEFAPNHGGVITARNQFDQVTASAAAIVYAWPMVSAHPTESLNKPILHPSHGRNGFVAAAKQALVGQLRTEKSPRPKLSAELLSKFMPS